jgi:hypothetical protein
MSSDFIKLKFCFIICTICSNIFRAAFPPFLNNLLLNAIWRRVICSKFICSKNLLDTKISTARHHSSRWQKYMKLLENQKSMPYVSCRADASFRSKWTTARIASARQKIKKMSTARQYFLVKKMVYTYGR